MRSCVLDTALQVEVATVVSTGNSVRFKDPTLLGNHAQQHFAWRTIHGFTILDLNKNQFSILYRFLIQSVQLVYS